MTTILNNANHYENKKEEQLEKCKRLLSSRLAPLASFEDLPTDEQNSSSSDDEKNHPTSIQNSSQITVLITDHDDGKIHSWNDSESQSSIIINDRDRLQSLQQPKGRFLLSFYHDLFENLIL